MRTWITVFIVLSIGLLALLDNLNNDAISTAYTLPLEQFNKNTVSSASSTLENTMSTSSALSTHYYDGAGATTSQENITTQTTYTHNSIDMITQNQGQVAEKQTLMAWIYPYQPACQALEEYSDGRKIDILKPEFFTINGGALLLLDDSKVRCNGYSPTFIESLKQHSISQFVTISSASTADMTVFLQQALASDTSIETLVQFIVTNDVTGIELNFEDFGSWTDKNYTDFKLFVSRIGTALHAEDKQLMVVGPPIANAVEEKWFHWRYEDFISLPVDYMVVMGYDYQYDHGPSEPIAPLDWLRDVITWISARYPQSKLTIALPSYGYEGTYGTYQISILTHKQIKLRPGYHTAIRNSRSAEMTWQYGDSVYFYQDSTSLAKKRDLVASMGIQSISIWHLGGNPWFE